MKTIKHALIILLAILMVANVASYFYFGTSDTEVPPTISCPSEPLEISVEDVRNENAQLLLQDAVAKDEQDGDLTHRILIGSISNLISKDMAKVTYLVFDSDNNAATCERKIRYVDYRRPTFEIVEPLVFSPTEEVAMLARLKANDVLDGDISNNIRVSTLEPTSNSELYHVTVQVSNSSGDTSWVTLPVQMLENDLNRPKIELKEHLIYLDKGTDFKAHEYIDSVTVSGENQSLLDVVTDNTVDTGDTGIYYVTYSYSANGRTGVAILTVVVQ